jgi:hypothetical protein
MDISSSFHLRQFFSSSPSHAHICTKSEQGPNTHKSSFRRLRRIQNKKTTALATSRMVIISLHPSYVSICLIQRHAGHSLATFALPRPRLGHHVANVLRPFWTLLNPGLEGSRMPPRTEHGLLSSWCSLPCCKHLGLRLWRSPYRARQSMLPCIVG